MWVFKLLFGKNCIKLFVLEIKLQLVLMIVNVVVPF